LILFFIGFGWSVAAQDVEVFPQLGHSGSVGAGSLKFNPNGKQIISVGDNI